MYFSFFLLCVFVNTTTPKLYSALGIENDNLGLNNVYTFAATVFSSCHSGVILALTLYIGVDITYEAQLLVK